MDHKLDLVVFGATGFTGKRTIPYLHKLCEEDGRQLKWGIAGRSEEKLKRVLGEYAQKLGADSLNSTPIIIADVADELSILAMAQKTKIVLNCCGPYQLYGEVVVKCCAMTGTHYVDVTGETHFQDIMLSRYGNTAEEKGVYIVHGCGMDSMGVEMPMNFITKSFQGVLNSVEIFMHRLEDQTGTGSALNFGTWSSIVHALSDLKSVWASKRAISLPKMSPSCSLRFPFSRNASIGIPNKRILPFPSPDEDVIIRSQSYFYENGGKRPIQVRHYYLLDSWKSILKLLFMGMITIIFSQFSCGRKLLLKYPKVFSGGHFDHESPNEEVVENTKICMYFYGKGWSNKKDSQFNQPPNKSILGKIDIVNPAYGFTCLAVVLSAIIILTEPSKLPKKGGVYTPAVAFFHTSMVEALQKNGVPLEILSVNDL
uniref:Saccharopine dehydrogenase NADP binding domain-containing protein n=1 Tax=Photinus pyralis TaxID=7054 RepID=A0A1Y1MIX5_PHOPY